EKRQKVHADINRIKDAMNAAKIERAAKKKSRGEKILVAVATKGGGIVNQHFGHAKEFQIFEVDGVDVKFVGHRKVDHYCQGGYGEQATLDNIIGAIADCKAVLALKIGDCPQEMLKKAGVEPFQGYDTIDKVALKYYEGFVASH
ncbi:MAG: NifB/NifX family molybdenum-iron cluster-binding protein, partial [Pleurocapsa sp.]